MPRNEVFGQVLGSVRDIGVGFGGSGIRQGFRNYDTAETLGEFRYDNSRPTHPAPSSLDAASQFREYAAQIHCVAGFLLQLPEFGEQLSHDWLVFGIIRQAAHLLRVVF